MAKEKTLRAKFKCNLNKLIKLMKEPRKMVLISAFVIATCIMLVEIFFINNWMPEELNSYYHERLEMHTMCVSEGYLLPESCSNTKGKNVYLYVFWKCLEKIRFTFYWIWYRKIGYLYLSLRLTLFSDG